MAASSCSLANRRLSSPELKNPPTMWRQNPFPATEDSDQSLSDDEDLDGVSSRNCVALSGCSEKEGGFQILSQLEKLRDASRASSAMKYDRLVEKPAGFSLVEDELEIPSFGIEGGLISSLKRRPKCCSDEDMISDDEGNNILSKFSITSSEKKGEEEPSSLVMKQAVTGLLSGNALNSSSCAVNSKEDQSLRASNGKVKPKFSLGCYLQKAEPSSCFTTKDEFLLSGMACELPASSKHAESANIRYSAANDILDSEEGKKPESPIASPAEVSRHGHSMAELLDSLHERLPTGLPREDNKVSRKGGRKMQSLMKRSIEIVEDSEDEPDSMDSDSPGDKEINSQNLKIPPPEKRRQTLADCFQAVLDATPWMDRDSPAAIPNPSGFGLFARLQQVMQNEKERELDFVNNLHTSGMPLCGTSCLHVLILSSYLDARLIVCRCSIEKIPERLQEQHSPESASLWRRQRTVIFSPRTCSNVDLEVGKMICIYPPWKDVRVDDVSILLCTCFSQVSV